jgi:fumarate reductase subunit D
MACTYDIFYDRWRSCTISYTFGTLPNRIGAYRYISAIASCVRLLLLLLPINCALHRVEDHI